MNPRQLNTQVILTFAALVTSCWAWLMINLDLLVRLLALFRRVYSFHVVSYPWLPSMVELIGFGLIINSLLYGGVVFIVTRLGHLRRLRNFRPATPQELGQLYRQIVLPTLAILIPSYKEEPGVVRRTLLSAALLEYPRRRVVLLIDDPPRSKTRADEYLLAGARALPGEVAALLCPKAKALRKEYHAFVTRNCNGSIESRYELRRLAALYEDVADWFETQVRVCDATDHETLFFREQVLRRPAEAHRHHAQRLLDLQLDSAAAVDADYLKQEYRRLASLFEVELSSFERKQYENLSHEPNKAMNLNSYISLMGNEWQPFRHGEHVYLQQQPRGRGALCIAEPDYIITLDADSLLLHDYALRLVHEMEGPGGERRAIVQTPYSAFPGASNALESIAGAQTDIQYIVHQGFTQHRATFWVGANALLRKRALDEIVNEVTERGHLVKKYIQDRTVIEDTESSIDLVQRGWELFNYPMRLAYSATPPDFGSLLIQRRRWANGGLIIFPKMARHVLSGPDRLRKLPEGFLRTHYLVSTAVTNLALLALILLSLNTDLVGPWLILAVGMYFAVYAQGLREAGYRRSDLFRVWALNLLLIPVNLAGASKSVQQVLTGKRSPFGRTPKVGHRTASPAWLPLSLIALAIYCIASAAFDAYKGGQALDVGFSALNGFILVYGITVFIGWSSAWEDVKLALPETGAAKARRLALSKTKSQRSS